MPIEAVERLEMLALLADVKAAIGEHAIHIEDGSTDALRGQQQLRCE